MENQAKYPDYIMKNVRQNYGLAADDHSCDSDIMEMPKKEIVDRYFTWLGIIGWGGNILEVVSDVYGVPLFDQESGNQVNHFNPNALHIVGKNIIEHPESLGEEDAATLYQAAKEIELLQWRIETALKASLLDTIDSPRERMEMILKGEYDDRQERVLEGGSY